MLVNSLIWQEEVIARMDAEKKLREAESSVYKLDNAVTLQTPNIEQDVKDEMVVNVNHLKSKDLVFYCKMLLSLSLFLCPAHECGCDIYR